LNPASKEICIILLPPKSSDDDDYQLECGLLYTSLDDDHRLQYEALSYCWGNVDDTIPIELCYLADSDDTSDFCTAQQYQVIRSLHAALRRFQSAGKSRFLWVDAICINQNDPVERSNQVRFMSQIYSKSERVLVWLG
ncbi:HET-domain-containing protein, partial [Lentithecium fluviatile CBS 122367]